MNTREPLIGDTASGSPLQRTASSRDSAWSYVPALELAVCPLTTQDVLDRISSAIDEDTPILIAAHNLHSAYLFHINHQFRELYRRADIAVIDGWPVLALLNRARRRDGLPVLSSAYRIGSTDWIPGAVDLAGVRRVCVIGATAAANEQFIARARDMNPNTRFLGIPGNPWSPSKLERVAAAARAFDPQLTLVGMGMPLQESVVAELMSRGLRGAVATVGGAIDQLAGEQSHAPRWTGRWRVEWLWRLANNPRRLGHRYLIEPVMLARLLRERRSMS